MTKRNESAVIEIDCALLMMLDEERDLFLQQNSQLIVEKVDSAGFVPFTFFDKEGKQRAGVIFSKGKEMGNTEACKMFYEFSRRYKAHLYINLGVAGYFKDMNIGDVLIANRLSTLGENNATNAPWQIKDGSYRGPNIPQRSWDSFRKNSKKRLSEFYAELQKHSEYSEEKFSDLMKEEYNTVKKGRCITVPEVIKGDENDRFPITRVGNVIDMEAYYLYDWHELIKNREPWLAVENSVFLSFKSVSDMANDTKAVVEECGSRTLAMANLCDVVCEYLTEIHTFERAEDQTIYSYFQSKIGRQSLDPLFQKDTDARMEKKFGNLCRYFMTVDSGKGIIGEKDSIAAACKFLAVPKKTLVLSGHSGTGKSTFISYVYQKISKNQMAILIDFSKFNSSTLPTDRQVVYLLERLLAQENSVAVFLDGVDVNCETYDLLLGAIQGKTYTNLSLCIGDITDNLARSAEISTRNPNDLLPSGTAVERYSFGGVSVYSPYLEPILKNAAEYFAGIQETTFEQDKILKYIRQSRLSHVDFRLLKMFADNGIQFELNQSFYEFMDRYCAQKVKRNVCSQLYSHVPFALDEDKSLSDEELSAYQTFSQNSFTRAFLFANCIAAIVGAGNKETMTDLLKSDYLLSNDMNLLLTLKLGLEKGTARDNFIENLLPWLSDPSITKNQSAQTQLIYSIFQIKPYSRNLEKKRKELLVHQVRYAKEQCTLCRANGEDYYHWSIQYRTLSILMWHSLEPGDRRREHLDEYNHLLLTDSDTRHYNLSFHLYYYSQREFTFSQVNTFENDSVTDEMFFNTYFTLTHALRKENFGDREYYYNPFVCMNIITFAHLIQDLLIGLERFTYLKKPVFRTFQRLIDSVGLWNEVPSKGSVSPRQLVELLNATAKNLNLSSEA